MSSDSYLDHDHQGLSRRCRWQTPETAVAGTQQLTILADATNGTLFYDVDAKTVTTITRLRQ